MAINSNWHARLMAAAIHFIVTLLVASIAAGLIFFVWFPGEFAKMVGGAKLFLLVICSDIVLGPLISLVIFNTRKLRKELIADYLIVGLIQLGALIYGVFVVAESRPIFVAFLVDRFEVVTAIELDDADLAAAIEPQYRSRSWWGPKLIGVQLPADMSERSNLLFSAVAGKDAQLMPKYYRHYETMIGEIKQKGVLLQALHTKNKNFEAKILDAESNAGLEEVDLRWLPVHSRFGFWIVLIDANTGYPVKYLPIDPY